VQIQRIYQRYQSVLADRPVLDDRATSIYGDYYKSFVLLSVQMEMVFAFIAKEHDYHKTPQQPSRWRHETWEDLFDDLEDNEKDLRRWIDQQEQSRFLEVIKLCDSIERLQRFSPPDPLDQDLEPVYKGLKQLFQATTETGKSLRQLLRRRAIIPIPLTPGERPPIAYTRIVARDDHGNGDEFVIGQIVETGYFWKDRVLRKAAVTVISK